MRTRSPGSFGGASTERLGAPGGKRNRRGNAGRPEKDRAPIEILFCHIFSLHSS